MGRPISLSSEIIWSANDPFAEVMLPDAVNQDSSEQRTGTSFDVGNPFGQTNSRVDRFWNRLPRNRRCWRGFSKQNLYEAGFRLSLFVIHFTAPQQKDILTTGHCCIDLGQGWTWLRRRMRADGLINFGRLGIEGTEPASHCFPHSLGQFVSVRRENCSNLADILCNNVTGPCCGVWFSA